MNFIVSDILNIEADGLISSGNILLNMSGGINGALLQKYGDQLQKELKLHLSNQKKHFVEPGFVYLFEQSIGNYKGVTYSVGINAWYESNINLVADTITKSIQLLITRKCEKIVLGAIGTGYGNLSKFDFGVALKTAEYSWTKSNISVILAIKNEDSLKKVKEGYFQE